MSILNEVNKIDLTWLLSIDLVYFYLYLMIKSTEIVCKWCTPTINIVLSSLKKVFYEGIFHRRAK